MRLRHPLTSLLFFLSICAPASAAYTTIVANLPTCVGNRNGQIISVADGVDYADCSTGGATGTDRHVVACQCDTLNALGPYWKAVGGGAGSSGPADALAPAVVIEGTTADAFEGNFAFADPTADWTWAWSATGVLSAGGNLIAAVDNTYDLGQNASVFRFRNLYISGDIPHFGSIGNNTLNVWIRSGTDVRLGPIPITWGGTNAGSTDTTIERTAAGIVKFTNALHLTPLASPPRTCDATAEGDIYSDTSHALCYCDATSWNVLTGSGAGSCV